MSRRSVLVRTCVAATHGSKTRDTRVDFGKPQLRATTNNINLTNEQTTSAIRGYAGLGFRQHLCCANIDEFHDDDNERR